VTVFHIVCDYVAMTPMDEIALDLPWELVKVAVVFFHFVDE
jgi:hypothetical protein